MENWATDGRLRSLGRDHDSDDCARIGRHAEPVVALIFGWMHVVLPAPLAGRVCRGAPRMAQRQPSPEQDRWTWSMMLRLHGRTLLPVSSAKSPCKSRRGKTPYLHVVDPSAIFASSCFPVLLPPAHPTPDYFLVVSWCHLFSVSTHHRKQVLMLGCSAGLLRTETENSSSVA